MKLERLFYITIIAIVTNILPASAQYRLRGVVTDSLTGEPVSFASVYLRNTNDGVQTDDKGHFSFETSRPSGMLTVSFVGYKVFEKRLRISSSKSLHIKLVPESYELEEVVVRPGRERYKKDNPAVRFVKEMMAHKGDHSPHRHDYYIRDRHDKTTLAINNFTEEQQQKWLYRRFKFLKDYVDTSSVTGRPVLPVSVREKLATDLYRKSPSTKKQFVKARQRDGILPSLTPWV